MNKKNRLRPAFVCYRSHQAAEIAFGRQLGEKSPRGGGEAISKAVIKILNSLSQSVMKRAKPAPGGCIIGYIKNS